MSDEVLQKQQVFRYVDAISHLELLTFSDSRDSFSHWNGCWLPKKYLGVIFFWQEFCGNQFFPAE